MIDGKIAIVTAEIIKFPVPYGNALEQPINTLSQQNIGTIVTIGIINRIHQIYP